MDVISPPLKAYLADRGQGWGGGEEEEGVAMHGDVMGGGDSNQIQTVVSKWINKQISK